MNRTSCFGKIGNINLYHNDFKTVTFPLFETDHDDDQEHELDVERDDRHQQGGVQAVLPGVPRHSRQVWLYWT